MARNKVQFRKGLVRRASRQPTAPRKNAGQVVIASRWPNGFECRFAVGELQQ